MRKKIKDYVDNQIMWLQKMLDSKVEGIEEEKKTAFQSMEKRLDGMNEFRDTLKDQAAMFVTRKELWVAAFAVVTVTISVLALIFQLKK